VELKIIKFDKWDQWDQGLMNNSEFEAYKWAEINYSTVQLRER
jgi:hypothetical protein